MQKGWTSSEFIIKSCDANVIIIGYASVFNVVDNHNDLIKSGAFQSSKNNHVKLLWQHDATKPIGIVNFIQEDEYGLRIEAEINVKTQYGLEASELIKQKAIDGLSIGFNIKDYEYNGQGQRIINDLDLVEVSVVTFPANNMAVINDVKNLSTKNYSGKALDRLERLITNLGNL